MATNAKRIWDNYQVIGEVQKNTGLKFIIAAAIRDGVKYVYVREFYLRKRDGKWMPGRDGIAVPIKQPVDNGAKLIEPFNDLAIQMSMAADKLPTMALYDEEHAVYVEAK